MPLLPYFTSPKSARWRVAGIEDLPLSAVDDLHNGLESLLLQIGVTVDDIQVRGSYAFGCARPHSDIDIGLRVGAAALQTLPVGWWLPRNVLANQLQVPIDISLLPFGGLSEVYYSLRTRLLVGRLPGQPMLVRRSWVDNQWSVSAQQSRIWEES